MKKMSYAEDKALGALIWTAMDLDVTAVADRLIQAMNYSPEELFEYEELKKWAVDNGFVDEE